MANYFEVVKERSTRKMTTRSLPEEMRERLNAALDVYAKNKKTSWYPASAIRTWDYCETKPAPDWMFEQVIDYFISTAR